jgi:hypothetical protein
MDRGACHRGLCVVLYLIERSGWKGFVLPWIDATRYVVFFVIFFLGVLIARK